MIAPTAQHHGRPMSMECTTSATSKSHCLYSGAVYEEQDRGSRWRPHHQGPSRDSVPQCGTTIKPFTRSLLTSHHGCGHRDGSFRSRTPSPLCDDPRTPRRRDSSPWNRGEQRPHSQGADNSCRTMRIGGTAASPGDGRTVLPGRRVSAPTGSSAPPKKNGGDRHAIDHRPSRTSRRTTAGQFDCFVTIAGRSLSSLVMDVDNRHQHGAEVLLQRTASGPGPAGQSRAHIGSVLMNKDDGIGA